MDIDTPTILYYKRRFETIQQLVSDSNSQYIGSDYQYSNSQTSNSRSHFMENNGRPSFAGDRIIAIINANCNHDLPLRPIRKRDSRHQENTEDNRPIKKRFPIP